MQHEGDVGPQSVVDLAQIAIAGPFNVCGGPQNNQYGIRGQIGHLLGRLVGRHCQTNTIPCCLEGFEVFTLLFWPQANFG